MKRKTMLVLFIVLMMMFLFAAGALASTGSGDITVNSIDSKCNNVTVNVTFSVRVSGGIQAAPPKYFCDGRELGNTAGSPYGADPYTASGTQNVSLGALTAGQHTIEVRMYFDGAWRTCCSAAFNVSNPTHTGINEVSGIEPNCTEAGYLSYYQCSGCKNCFSDSQGSDQIDADAWKRPGGNGYKAPLEHDFTAVSYIWNEDSCTAERTCTRSGCGYAETETQPGEYVMDQPVSCTASEMGHYQAVFTNPVFEMQKTDPCSVSKGDPIPHKYVKPYYVWDGASCTAVRICGLCDGEETETVTGTFVPDTEATCITAALGHYTVSFENPAFTVQNTSADSAKSGEPLGHDFVDPSYIWGYSSKTGEYSCIAECACSRCDAARTETAAGVYVMDTAAACTEAETGHYEASFTKEPFTAQATDTEPAGSPLGHQCGDWVIVLEPTYEAEGREEKTCSRCETVVESRAIPKLDPTPTPVPTATPTAEPTATPTAEPTAEPTAAPTAEPTAKPTAAPTTAPEKTYLNLLGVPLKQILTTIPATGTMPKTLLIAADPEEELSETDEPELVFTADDLKALTADGFARFILVSPCGTPEVTADIADMQALLKDADQLKLRVTDNTELPEELLLPEGCTAAGPVSRVTACICKNGEMLPAEPEQFADIKLRMPAALPLTDVQNDMVGLFLNEEGSFTELQAEYVFDEDSNTGCWVIPFAGNGLYLMAEKAMQ